MVRATLPSFCLRRTYVCTVLVNRTWTGGESDCSMLKFTVATNEAAGATRFLALPISEGQKAAWQASITEAWQASVGYRCGTGMMWAHNLHLLFPALIGCPLFPYILFDKYRWNSTAVGREGPSIPKADSLRRPRSFRTCSCSHQ